MSRILKGMGVRGIDLADGAAASDPFALQVAGGRQ
jgi:hypothetical protein